MMSTPQQGGKINNDDNEKEIVDESNQKRMKHKRIPKPRERRKEGEK